MDTISTIDDLTQYSIGLPTEVPRARALVENTAERLRAFFRSTPSEITSSTSRLLRILKQIDILQSNENIDGYIFKPMPRATKVAKAYMWVIYKEDNNFPEPEIESDGLGGIVIQWNHNGRTVTLGCRPDRTAKDFIYHDNGRYGILDASPDNLKERLTWLIS